MPDAPEQKSTPVCYACLLALAAGIVWLCYVCPVVIVAGVPLAAVVWALSLLERQERKNMAAYRLEVNIHALAGSFESRRVDIRFIRAVCEELQKRRKGDQAVCPIRASDRLEKDLHIGRDELYDVTCDLAARTGYDRACCKNNLLVDRMKTVEDMVLSLTHLAMISEADQHPVLSSDRGSLDRTLVSAARLRAAS